MKNIKTGYGNKLMIGNSQQISQWLWNQPREKIFEIKEHKQKRSLSQNAYLWELIGKLADKMTISKEDMYLQMLKDYGQSMLVPIPSGDSPNGWFKYYEFYTTSTLNGKEADYYKVYKGSSEYNTLEMKYLLDGVIVECENLGIPTLTQEQIEKMKLR